MQLELISRYPATDPKSVPLLFVHGSFTGAGVWDAHFLPYFAAQGYAAHAISLRGHGASAGHERLSGWSLADYVADLDRGAVRALRKAGFQQPAMVLFAVKPSGFSGHSTNKIERESYASQSSRFL